MSGYITVPSVHGKLDRIMLTAPKPRERGLIFTGASVRAILADRKTQTRRLIKFPAGAEYDGHRPRGFADSGDVFCSKAHEPTGTRVVHCQWRVGDRAYVKETYALASGFLYRADGGGGAGVHWVSPMLMPKRAARAWLDLTEIRVERVQDISEADASAEGGDLLFPPPDGKGWPQSHRELYSRQWDSIHGEGAWASNPWVWALSFRRIR